MTPTHQRIIDDILARMKQRVSELIQQCLPAIGKRPAEPNIEELRDTLLGQYLATIVHYTEGYVLTYEGDGHVLTRFVARCLYGDPLSTQGFRLPQKWSRSELEKLVHNALLRFFEEERLGQLLTFTDKRKLFAVFRGDIPLFYRNDVTRFQHMRARKQS